MAAEDTLANKTARGVIMLTGSIAIGKVISALGQIALAWLLVPEDFGIVALAFLVMSFVRSIEQMGLREILIREQQRFDRWVNSAFWLAGTIGLLGVVLMVVAAPIAASVFEEPELALLIYVLAPASPLLSLSQICEAKLERDLRYKQVVGIQFSVMTSQTILAVIFAALDFGAVSFVLPRPIVQACALAYGLWLVRPKLHLRPQLHRWRVLLKRGLPVAGAAIFTVAYQQSDYLILGLITTSAVLGYYYFAYMQSTQIVQVFTNSLMRVLVPGLSAMRDHPRKQVTGYLKGANLMSAIIAPLAMIQAAGCAPLLRLIFGEKWLEAIPLLQILSISVMFATIVWPLNSLLMAQGRYLTRLVLTICSTIVFLGLVSTGALLGKPTGHEALGAALAVLAYRFVNAPSQAFVACRNRGVTFADILVVFVRSPINAGITVGAVWVLSVMIPGWFGLEGVPADVLSLAVVLACSPFAYALWVRTTQPALWHEVMSRSLAVLPASVQSRLPRWVQREGVMAT